MNPLEEEILKYRTKGYTLLQNRKLKYGTRVFLKYEKEGLFVIRFQCLYIYYVDGDASENSIEECFKDYLKFFIAEEFSGGGNGIMLVSGEADKVLFNKYKKAILREEAEIYKSIKLITCRKTKKANNKIDEKKETLKKRVRLTPKERLYIWEHPEKYGKTCNICNGKIEKLSDLELDHTVPYSKGGTKMALAHRDCNKMKGSKNLKYVQTKMGFKTTKTRERKK